MPRRSLVLAGQVVVLYPRTRPALGNALGQGHPAGGIRESLIETLYGPDSRRLCALVIRLPHGASVPKKMYKGTSLWRWYKYWYVFAFNPRKTSVSARIRLSETPS
jgi:hypothetical protein